jgi:hypothetical protein
MLGGQSEHTSVRKSLSIMLRTSFKEPTQTNVHLRSLSSLYTAGSMPIILVSYWLLLVHKFSALACVYMIICAVPGYVQQVVKCLLALIW